MRINEYSNLNEFLSQYTGVWGPSDGHWYGLDFRYNGHEYRFHTGTMYGEDDRIDVNGVAHLFGLYEKVNEDTPVGSYKLLFEGNSVESVLDCTVIENKPFRMVIMDDTTELLGQD